MYLAVHTKLKCVILATIKKLKNRFNRFCYDILLDDTLTPTKFVIVTYDVAKS